MVYWLRVDIQLTVPKMAKITVPAERTSLPTGPNKMKPASPETDIVSRDLRRPEEERELPILCTSGWFILKSIKSFAVYKANIPRNTVNTSEGTMPTERLGQSATISIMAGTDEITHPRRPWRLVR